MLLVEGKEYFPYDFKLEEELEKIVDENSKKIFGFDSLYINRKTKLKSVSGIGSIPDGYVFILSKPYRWFVVEVELSNHPIHDHVVNQVNKFTAGLRSLETRKSLVKVLHETIIKDHTLENWVKQKIGTSEIHAFLTEMLDEKPVIVIIIDRKDAMLEDALFDLSSQKEVMELVVYKTDDKDKKLILQF